MKKIAVAFLFLFVAGSVFAASPTQRYVVATRRVTPLAQAKQIITDLAPGMEPRNVDTYENFPAFAADLTAEEAAALQKSAAVRYVEPVAERHALDFGGAQTSLDVSRNLFAQVVPLGLDAVHARDVWPVTRGEGINVAIIDTGIDYTHPDLAPAYAGGYNAITKTNDPMDDNGHGSHVAGTIAAADNDIGVVGVAPGVKIWSVKVLKANGSGTTDAEIAALDWVISKKAAIGGNWVVNLSLGSTTFNQAEKDAFQRAVAAGLVICAASGNESTADVPAAVDYPAAYPNVLAIGAIDSTTRQIASFSNQGPEVALVGPGVNVLSTVLKGTGSIAGVQSSSGSFTGAMLTGSAKGTLSGKYVYCGIGNTSDFPASVAGNIALIKRGSLTFNQKTRNALAAGAKAVVIFNSDSTALTFTLIPTDGSDPSAATFNWPITVALTQADGQKLADAGTGTITVTAQTDDYDVYSGTSMATPHATAVAALAWAAAPNVDAGQLRAALKNTADDLGAPGYDMVFGYGELNALNAAKTLAPAKFGSQSTPPPPTPHPGRKVLRRG